MCNSNHVKKRDISSPTLDIPDIGSMDSRQIGEFFLRYFPGGSQVSNRLSKSAFGIYWFSAAHCSIVESRCV